MRGAPQDRKRFRPTRDTMELETKGSNVKKLLVIIIGVVLIITGGGYASTWITATASIGVSAASADFAAVTAEDLTDLAPTVFGDYTSTWPSGTLFTVTPDAAFSGDLMIKVYLINTGELTKYYEHLNMVIQFWSSDNTTADEQGISQALTLDNSEALFAWVNGTGTGPYKVELIGGGYRLHPWKTMTGGSVQPQLWLEISQR